MSTSRPRRVSSTPTLRLLSDPRSLRSLTERRTLLVAGLIGLLKRMSRDSDESSM